MSERPEDKQSAGKRRWFQFHLSTLVILTIVLGGLTVLNLTPRDTQFRSRLVPLDFKQNPLSSFMEAPPGTLCTYYYRTYGWPWPCLLAEEDYPRFHENGAYYTKDVAPYVSTKTSLLAADLAAALLILASLGVILEWLARRARCR